MLGEILKQKAVTLKVFLEQPRREEPSRWDMNEIRVVLEDDPREIPRQVARGAVVATGLATAAVPTHGNMWKTAEDQGYQVLEEIVAIPSVIGAAVQNQFPITFPYRAVPSMGIPNNQDGFYVNPGVLFSEQNAATFLDVIEGTRDPSGKRLDYDYHRVSAPSLRKGGVSTHDHYVVRPGPFNSLEEATAFAEAVREEIGFEIISVEKQVGDDVETVAIVKRQDPRVGNFDHYRADILEAVHMAEEVVRLNGMEDELERQGIYLDGLADGFIQEESAYRLDIIRGEFPSEAGALGTMQVMGPAREQVRRHWNLPWTDEEIDTEFKPSVATGMIYALGELLGQFDGKIRPTAEAFNWGPTRMLNGQTPPAKVREYGGNVVEAGKQSPSNP